MGRWWFLQWIQQDWVQIAQPDMFACGGVTEWQRIADMASAHGVPVCTHAWHDFHAPLMADAPNAMMVEYFGDSRIVNLQEILDRPQSIEGGYMILSDAPGFGFDFDEKAVARTTRIAWKAG